MCLKQFKSWRVPIVVSSIVVVSTLTRCVLLHSVCNFKAVQMDVQRCLIRELILYEFELDHNASAEEIKNIWRVKEENAVIRWLKKFRSSCTNRNNQTRSVKPKSMDPEAVLPTIEANLTSCIRRVSGELGISEPSVIRHFHDLGKSIRSCWIVPHVQLKYCKTFDST